MQMCASVAAFLLAPQTDGVIKSSLQSMQWQDSCTLADATFAACFCSSVATGKPARHVERFSARVEGSVCLKMHGSPSSIKQIWHSDNQVLNCYSGFLTSSEIHVFTCVSVGGRFFFFALIQIVLCHLTSNFDSFESVYTRISSLKESKSLIEDLIYLQVKRWKTDSSLTLIQLNADKTQWAPGTASNAPTGGKKLF